MAGGLGRGGGGEVVVDACGCRCCNGKIEWRNWGVTDSENGCSNLGSVSIHVQINSWRFQPCRGRCARGRVFITR